MMSLVSIFCCNLKIMLINMPENLTSDVTVKVVKEYEGMIKLLYSDKQPVRRFGHATSMLGTRQAVCVGGFGEQAGKHMRVTDIIVVDTESMDTRIVNPNVDNRKIEGLLIYISDLNHFASRLSSRLRRQALQLNSIFNLRGCLFKHYTYMYKYCSYNMVFDRKV